LNINVVEDKIYYVNGNDGKIYCVNTDGSGRKLLSEDQAAWLIVVEGQIYYTITGSNIYSININGSDKRIVAELVRDYYKEVTYEIKSSMSEDKPEYRFVAKGMTSDKTDEWTIGSVMGLEVYDENDHLLLTVDFSETYYDQVTGVPVYNEMMDTMGLHVVDVNYDGYKDVIILNNYSGAHGNTWYGCWLWNSKASSFEECESFADIYNPSLDSMKQCIYSTGGSGAGYQNWDIYQFIDGDFVVTNSLSFEFTNDSSIHYIEQKLENGEMESVRDEVIQADSLEEAQNKSGYTNDELWELGNPRWYMCGGHEADQWLE
jgi:hypothetical protein